MRTITRNLRTYPPLMIGGAMLAGVFEFVALRRAQHSARKTKS